MFICLNRLSISLIAMNTFFKSYVDTDLAWLHYTTFIEPIVISPNEAISFDSELFTNTFINKFIEAKNQILFSALRRTFLHKRFGA
jgi:hypothetical protein